MIEGFSEFVWGKMPDDIRGALSLSKKKNKYGAVKVKQDGITFDSKAENGRYNTLLGRQSCGVISGLKTHVRYPLVAPAMGFGEEKLVGYYEVDFEYVLVSKRKLISEDYKGHDTAISKWKRKHFAAQYGREVRIVKKIDE
jgi:hypothetical protein